MKIHHFKMDLFGEEIFYVEPECYHGSRTEKMQEWLKETIPADRWCFFPDMKVIFLFRFEEDFLLFKLRWGGDDVAL